MAAKVQKRERAPLAPMAGRALFVGGNRRAPRALRPPIHTGHGSGPGSPAAPPPQWWLRMRTGRWWGPPCIAPAARPENPPEVRRGFGLPLDRVCRSVKHTCTTPCPSGAHSGSGSCRRGSSAERSVGKWRAPRMTLSEGGPSARRIHRWARCATDTTGERSHRRSFFDDFAPIVEVVSDSNGPLQRPPRIQAEVCSTAHSKRSVRSIIRPAFGKPRTAFYVDTDTFGSVHEETA